MSGWTESRIPGVAPAVRQAAAGSPWKVREGALSRIQGRTTVHASIFADAMNFRAKPLLWNDIYWSIMGTSLSRPPQATGHWAGFSLPVPILAQAQVRGTTPGSVASDLLAFADAETACLSAFDRPPEARFFPDRDDDFQMARIVERIAAGDTGAARTIAEGVVAGRILSSYTHSSQAGTFFELALARIEDGVFARSA